MKPFNRFLIPFDETNSFERLAVGYINDDPFLNDFYDLPDDIAGIKNAIKSYKNPRLDRELLTKVLISQYENNGIKDIPPKVLENIHLLKDPNSFTITAGHQLNIFGGPLYITYKLVSAINIAQKLNKEIPSNRFVPVYWMASEDHDIEEISEINLYGKNIRWDSNWQGTSGDMPLQGFEKVLTELKNALGTTELANEIYNLINDCYSKSKTLAEATRKFVNLLYGKYGLVIVDGNAPEFKKQISDILLDEVSNRNSSRLITESASRLEKKYPAQVNPREINLFYLGKDYRSRLVEDGNNIKVLDTDISFTPEKARAEISNHPERFSPNVVTRPLYQESILPGVVFVGGPAEISYWLELKSLFNHHQVPMPVLFHRSCALIIEKNISKKLNKLSIKEKEIFLDADEIIRQLMSRKNNQSGKFEQSLKTIATEFNSLGDSISKIDPTLRAAFESENQKVAASIHHLEEKILRSIKKKNETEVTQIRKIKERLFPSGKLQERIESFIPFFITHGNSFLEMLLEHLDPFEKRFVVLEENETGSVDNDLS